MSFPAAEAQPQAKKGADALGREFTALLNATLDDIDRWETGSKNKFSMKLQALGMDSTFRRAKEAGNGAEMEAQLARLSSLRSQFQRTRETVEKIRDEAEALVAEAERIAVQRPDFAEKAQRVKGNTEVMLEHLEEENYPAEELVTAWDNLKLIDNFLRRESLKPAAEG